MSTSSKLVCATLAISATWLVAQSPAPDLEQGFRTPPDSAKPRVWWHWMNGNVTKEGITADLEWMKRVGIGGMQMFDGSLGVPQFTEKRLVWMTPDWKDAFRHTAAEADRLGLEMSMAASGGWSETAGPWVKPEQGMKKLVWSETRVHGPRNFTASLAHPPSINGKFQDMPAPPSFEVPEMQVCPVRNGQTSPRRHRMRRHPQPKLRHSMPTPRLSPFVCPNRTCRWPSFIRS
jgi:alpha-L-rhamnosidase